MNGEHRMEDEPAERNGRAIKMELDEQANAAGQGAQLVDQKPLASELRISYKTSAEQGLRERARARNMIYLNRRIIFGKRIFKHPSSGSPWAPTSNAGDPGEPPVEPLGSSRRVRLEFRRRHLRKLAHTFAAHTGRNWAAALEAAQVEEEQIAGSVPHTGLYVWRMQRLGRALREGERRFGRG